MKVRGELGDSEKGVINMQMWVLQREINDLGKHLFDVSTLVLHIEFNHCTIGIYDSKHYLVDGSILQYICALYAIVGTSYNGFCG
jgi:hypothetical protein